MHEKLFSNRPPIVILILLTVFIAIYVVDVFIISFMSFAVTTIWESLISVSAFNPWLFTAAVFNDDSHTLIIIPSLISHAFIHKNLWHLILNCGFFIIFGAPVATRIGWEQLAIARAIARFEPVRLLVNDDDDIELADATNIQLYRINHTDMWARDTLPTFVFASDENGGKDKSLAAIGWNFNGWGNKYKKLGYDAEYDLAQRTADHFAFDFIKSNIISEGGAIETDGCGTLLTTETCLLNKNRNPGLSKLDIEIALYQTVGCRKIIWLYGSTADRVTDGHIDGIARFIRPGVVACDLIDDPLDPEYREMQENANRLAKATDVMGNPLHIVRVKRPRFDKMPPRGNDFAATYLNFYIANGGIIMPKFDDSKRDEEAFAIIDKLYPQREVIQLAVDNINEGGGGIHCVTQQLPAV